MSPNCNLFKSPKGDIQGLKCSKGVLFVREGTQKPVVICVHCKLPITREQRPSVQLKNGDELHVECYDAYKEAGQRKPD